GKLTKEIREHARRVVTSGVLEMLARIRFVPVSRVHDGDRVVQRSDLDAAPPGLVEEIRSLALKLGEIQVARVAHTTRAEPCAEGVEYRCPAGKAGFLERGGGMRTVVAHQRRAQYGKARAAHRHEVVLGEVE